MQSPLCASVHEALVDRIPTDLLDVLTSASSDVQLGMTLHAAALKRATAAATVALTIEINCEHFIFTHELHDDVFEDRVQLALLAIDGHGTPVYAESLDYDLRLSAEAHHRMQAFGLRTNHRISLLPGYRQLYVAARESGAREAGWICCELDVPDFVVQTSAMSGILLTAATADLAYTVHSDPEIAKLLPGPPTARRDFVRGDVLAVYVEIYRAAQSSALSSPAIATRLIAASGQEIFKSTQVGATQRESDTACHVYVVHVPLRDVSPGSYLLRVEAAPDERRGCLTPIDATSTKRDIRINVHPYPGLA